MHSHLDALSAPLYYPHLAARLVGMTPGRVKRWLYGYEYSYEVPSTGERTVRKKEPVVRGTDQESRYASFLDLVDLLFAKSFVEHGVSLQRVRRALDEVQDLIGGHHFARRVFFTSGREILLKMPEAGGPSAMLQLLSDGQWVIAPVIEQVGTQIDFDERTGLAERWYPLGHDGGVVLDPRIAFGAPTLVGRGVQTANVYDFYLAESRNAESVRKWLDLRRHEVRAAIDYEKRLLAA